MKPLRIALYSHDSLRLGHVRRKLGLAHALTNQLPGLSVRPVTWILISGTGLAPGFQTATGWDWVLLVPAGDPAAFAPALGVLSADPGSRDRLRTRARKQAEMRFSWDGVLSRITAALPAPRQLARP